MSRMVSQSHRFLKICAVSIAVLSNPTKNSTFALQLQIKAGQQPGAADGTETRSPHRVALTESNSLRSPRSPEETSNKRSAPSPRNSDEDVKEGDITLDDICAEEDTSTGIPVVPVLVGEDATGLPVGELVAAAAPSTARTAEELHRDTAPVSASAAQGLLDSLRGQGKKPRPADESAKTAEVRGASMLTESAPAPAFKAEEAEPSADDGLDDEEMARRKKVEKNLGSIKRGEKCGHCGQKKKNGHIITVCQINRR